MISTHVLSEILFISEQEQDNNNKNDLSLETVTFEFMNKNLKKCPTC